MHGHFCLFCTAKASLPHSLVVAGSAVDSAHFALKGASGVLVCALVVGSASMSAEKSNMSSWKIAIVGRPACYSSANDPSVLGVYVGGEVVGLLSVCWFWSAYNVHAAYKRHVNRSFFKYPHFLLPLARSPWPLTPLPTTADRHTVSSLLSASDSLAVHSPSELAFVFTLTHPHPALLESSDSKGDNNINNNINNNNSNNK